MLKFLNAKKRYLVMAVVGAVIAGFPLSAMSVEIASTLIELQPVCSFGGGVETGNLLVNQNLAGRSCKIKATLGVDISLVALDGGFGNPMDGHINTGLGGGPPAYIQAAVSVALPLTIDQRFALTIAGTRSFRSNIDNDDPQTFVQSILKRYAATTRTFDGGMLSSRSNNHPVAIQCTDIQEVSASSNINSPDGWGHDIFYKVVKVSLVCDE